MSEFDFDFFNSRIKNYEQKWFWTFCTSNTEVHHCSQLWTKPANSPTVYFYKFHSIVVLNPLSSFWLLL